MAAPAKQYQHFVPQFLLRNFSHPYTPEGGGGGRRQRRRNNQSGSKYEKGMFPGDPVVRCLDLAADQPVICEKPINRVLGMTNMYNSQDTNQPTDQQQEVEKLLSQLESRASQIFRKITKAFDQQEQGVWLMRSERNLLRKFLFILYYRGTGSHKRFCHDNPRDYSDNDKVLFQEYMTEHNYQRPMDVWLHSIKTIIQLEMDLDGKWIEELVNRMYPSDALWFISHMQWFYTTICTPSDASQEFLLTGNSYSVFEGFRNYVKDQDTGVVGEATHACLHYFSPVTPKLMIVIRYHTFPEPQEDKDWRVKKDREKTRRTIFGSLANYEGLLADLPVQKPNSNYVTAGADGRLYLNPGEDGRDRSDHKFHFLFFRISSEHVNRINAVLLDNCWGADPSAAVVYESQDAFSKTLEWYLTAPCDVGKVIQGPGADLHKATLMKLEAVSRSLGSQKQTVWERRPERPIRGFDAYTKRNNDRERAWTKTITARSREEGRKAFNEAFAQHPNTMGYIYFTALGGSMQTFRSDVEQAYRMCIFRVMIDKWSQGVDEKIRSRNRAIVEDAYMRCPPHRMWVYIKVARVLLGPGPTSGQSSRGADELDSFWAGGIEDGIANAYDRTTDDPRSLNEQIYIRGMLEIGRNTGNISSFKFRLERG